MKCEILYEDEEILIIRKPAGLATQSSSVAQPDAVSELKGYLSKKQSRPYLGVIHRLDQPVEGLLAFAKTPAAAANLTKQLSNGSLNKRYYALVCGKVMPPAGKLEDFLWKAPGSIAEVVTGRERDFPQAKRAVLSYTVLREAKLENSGNDGTRTVFGKETLEEGKAFEAERETGGIPISLLDVCIGTGRFHQIRAQLSHAGWPILGDRKYGSGLSSALSDRYQIKNIALCAYEMRIRIPKTGEERCWKILPETKAFTIIKG